MIRRDYILEMIEEFVRALTQIRALRQQDRWEENRLALDTECEKLAAAQHRKSGPPFGNRIVGSSGP